MLYEAFCELVGRLNSEDERVMAAYVPVNSIARLLYPLSDEGRSFEDIQEGLSTSKENISLSLTIMKIRGFLEEEDGVYSLTEKGKTVFEDVSITSKLHDLNRILIHGSIKQKEYLLNELTCLLETYIQSGDES